MSCHGSTGRPERLSGAAALGRSAAAGDGRPRRRGGAADGAAVLGPCRAVGQKPGHVGGRMGWVAGTGSQKKEEVS